MKQNQIQFKATKNTIYSVAPDKGGIRHTVTADKPFNAEYNAPVTFGLQSDSKRQKGWTLDVSIDEKYNIQLSSLEPFIDNDELGLRFYIPGQTGASNEPPVNIEIDDEDPDIEK